MNRPFFIALCGVAGAGKSTFAEALTRNLNARGVRVTRASFAEALKKSVDAAFDLIDPNQRIDWSNYEDKQAHRPLLVELGRAVRKKNPSAFPDYLVRKTRPFFKTGGDVVIIDDWRYLNEYGVLAKEGAVLPVLIERKGHAPANDEEARSLKEILDAAQDIPSATAIQEWHGYDELCHRVDGFSAYAYGAIRVGNPDRRGASVHLSKDNHQPPPAMTKGQKLYEAVNPDGVWVHLSSLEKFEWENKATAYHDSFTSDEKNTATVEWLLSGGSDEDRKAMLTEAVEGYEDDLRKFIKEADRILEEIEA